MPGLTNHCYRFGEFTLDAGQKVLLREGNPLLLAPKVVETLLTLVENRGRIIEKRELMTRLWPDTFVEESNLTYTIVQLRKTLGDDARHPRYIETIPRRGYRFIVDVEETQPAERIEQCAGLIAAVPSIAVLPFVDTSPDKDQGYFCEGLADELINRLASLPNLHVASRTSSFRFKSPALDIREVGKQLNVNTVLEGSVRKASGNIRITAQLISAVDGYQLWSGKYDRKLEDIFAVQDDIAQSTVKALQVVLSSADQRALQRVRTTSIEAYEYYLRGHQLFHNMRRASLESARRMYLKAIAIDDQFGPAYAGVADCSSFLYMDWGGVESDLADADRASLKAVEIDPGLAQAHASRGIFLAQSGRYLEAETEFETALHLNPRLYEANYYYARACFSQGKLDKAAQLLEQAAAVRPESIDALSMLSGIYRGQQRQELKEETSERCLDAVQNHLEFYPGDVRPLLLGAIAHIELGQAKRGLEWTRRAVELDSEDPNVLYNAACAFSIAGELEEAITCLEKSVPFCADRKWLDHDSYLDPLRSLPRFQELLQIQPRTLRQFGGRS
ncbi:MAG TPA: winged helix-turn-helix domain-containing protein [Pyrinomonadaceae bacterium]|nr:winged helix-turn-helix domain-containing protein [Pyrinomonadaceae bacterium]